MCVCSPEDEEGNEILLCEECDYGIHLKCKKPPLKHLPKGSFFCPGCHPRPMMGTAYIPFQDMGPNHSVPCVLPGSHRFSAYVVPIHGHLLHWQRLVLTLGVLCAGWWQVRQDAPVGW